jgi:hypothetical protein
MMLTGVVEPKLNVGRYCGPVGLEVMEAVRAMLPVKPPAGITVMATGATETDAPVRAKLALTAGVIVTIAVP